MAQDSVLDVQDYPAWRKIDWSRQNPLATGPVIDIILSRQVTNIRPSALYEVSANVGTILKIAIFPDLEKAVVLADQRGGAQLLLIRLEGMEVIRSLHTQDYYSNRNMLEISPDGTRIVYLGSSGHPINIFSDTGEPVATIVKGGTHPDNPIAFCLGHDDATLIVSYIDNRIREYSMQDGTLLQERQVEYENTKQYLQPVLSVTDQLTLFMAYHANEEQNLISVELERNVIVHDEALPSSVIVNAIDGKRLLVAKSNIRWEGYEIRDTHTLQVIKTVDMVAYISSIGTAYHEGRNAFLFLESRIQPLLLFAADTGLPFGMIQPPGGGCAMFDTSPDGRWIAAVVGPWNRGTITRSHIALYDLDAFLEKSRANSTTRKANEE